MKPNQKPHSRNGPASAATLSSQGQTRARLRYTYGSAYGVATMHWLFRSADPLLPDGTPYSNNHSHRV